MKQILCIFICLLLPTIQLTSCSQEDPETTSPTGTAKNDAALPDVPLTIKDWDGKKASDSSSDAVGVDNDLYHELNTFSRKVTVSFAGSHATVETASEAIYSHVDGSYVTIDFRSGAVSEVEIELKGASDDGGLKIYGASKFKLILNGVELTSKRGPAINNQCKKRMFVHLAGNSSNKLQDAGSYTEDSHYLAGSSPQLEDRKGAFFSEGDIIFSGTGTLEVKGKYRHGITSDGYMAVRPGTTIAVTEAADNCIHLKGDLTDGYGLLMLGGLIYCKATAPAGKGIKTDENIQIKGGELQVYTSGDATYNPATSDTSSSACLKSDKYVNISGGNLTLCSTGRGGKGINAGSTIDISGGEVAIGCTGDRFDYSADVTSSSKSVKANGNITISGGRLRIASTGPGGGSRGIESESGIQFRNCSAEIYAYDDAVNAATVSIEEGSVLNLCSIAEDGIKGKEAVNMSAGKVMSLGGDNNGKGVDCNVSDRFIFSGGELIAIGCKKSSTPSFDAETASVTILENFSGKIGSRIIETGVTFTMPRTYHDAYLLIAIGN